MKDRRGELDVTKVSGALFRSLLACLAVVKTVDGAEARVVRALDSRTDFGFVL